MRKDKKPTADKAILGETRLEIQGARVHNLRKSTYPFREISWC